MEPILVAYSGGLDSVALLIKLREEQWDPIPIYFNYRKVQGGKTAIDKRCAVNTLEPLGLILQELRVPLGDRTKHERNRFFIENLAPYALKHDIKTLALGTYKKISELDLPPEDLDPAILKPLAQKYGCELITWDDFDITTKAGEIRAIEHNKNNLAALFASWSSQSFHFSPRQCGRCVSCRERKHALIEVFGKDPTIYKF